MKIKLGQLKHIINLVLEKSSQPQYFPHIRDPLNVDFNDRQAIERMKKSDIDNNDEMSPHLSDDISLNDLGPVPPAGSENKPYAILDPFVDDWHVIPSPRRFS